MKVELFSDLFIFLSGLKFNSDNSVEFQWVKMMSTYCTLNKLHMFLIIISSNYYAKHLRPSSSEYSKSGNEWFPLKTTYSILENVDDYCMTCSGYKLIT